MGGWAEAVLVGIESWLFVITERITHTHNVGVGRWGDLMRKERKRANTGCLGIRGNVVNPDCRGIGQHVKKNSHGEILNSWRSSVVRHRVARFSCALSSRKGT